MAATNFVRLAAASLERLAAPLRYRRPIKTDMVMSVIALSGPGVALAVKIKNENKKPAPCEAGRVQGEKDLQPSVADGHRLRPTLGNRDHVGHNRRPVCSHQRSYGLVCEGRARRKSSRSVLHKPEVREGRRANILQRQPKRTAAPN